MNAASTVDPGALALQLGELMRGVSPSVRELAGSLLRSAASNPADAPRVADALRALLHHGPRSVPTGISAEEASLLWLMRSMSSESRAHVTAYVRGFAAGELSTASRSAA